MKWNLGITIVILALSSHGCKDETVNPSSPGSSSYSAYDSSGTLLVQGAISFDTKDSTITGEWNLSKIGNAQNTGPQVGTGKLEGSIHNETLFINMNPGWADNNVFLTGNVENGVLRGSWTWSSFRGPTSGGPFSVPFPKTVPRQQ